MEEGRNMSETLAEKLSEPSTAAAVNNLLDRLTELHETGVMDSFFETMQVVTFLKNVMADNMVQKNASMAGELVSMAYEAADPEMINAVRELKNLQKSGNLKVLSEASGMVGFFTNMVTDSMVQRIATFLSQFVEEVSTPNVTITNLLNAANTAIYGAVKQFSEKPPKPGLKNLLATMKDPEVQLGMMFMASIAKNMHKSLLKNYTGQ